jgi:hypothetical protein
MVFLELVEEILTSFSLEASKATEIQPQTQARLRQLLAMDLSEVRCSGFTLWFPSEDLAKSAKARLDALGPGAEMVGCLQYGPTNLWMSLLSVRNHKLASQILRTDHSVQEVSGPANFGDEQ